MSMNFLKNVAIALGIVLLAIFADIVKLRLDDPGADQAKIMAVLEVPFDLLLAALSLWLGLFFASDKDGQSRAALALPGILIAVSVILVFFLYALAPSCGGLAPWCRVYLPNAVGLASIGFTVAAARS